MKHFVHVQNIRFEESCERNILKFISIEYKSNKTSGYDQDKDKLMINLL
jgi:hypothetical protein